MPTIDDQEIIRIIREVLTIEAAALENLAHKVDLTFVNATRLIHESKGKVITTGVGKSGFVARKMTSTLLSTGTLAIFMHPTEAMHGDLGVVQKDDVIVMFSKSGESSELNALIDPLKRIGSKIIVVTASMDSTLARESTIALFAGVEKEACPLDLAPTASVVGALSIADALSIALMKMKDFRETDFAKIHPGGQLGRKLHLRVKDRMVPLERCFPLTSENSSLDDVLSILGKNMLGIVLLMSSDKKEVKAILTDGDVRRALNRYKEKIFDMSLAEFWTTQPASISAEMTVGEAIDYMESREKPFNVVLVKDQETVLGVARLHDLLN